MTEPSHGVFISYASEDVQAARRICEALRAAGIEVWFDQSELRGGEAWDQSIRRQIKACTLFIPVISQNTHARDEGYFRLEWKLAVDRSHLISANRAFLLPVAIDATPQGDEQVPERFRDVQWTRLPAGETPAAFVERVRRLLSPEPGGAGRARAAEEEGPVPVNTRPAPSWTRRGSLVAIVLLIVAGAAYLGRDRLGLAKMGTTGFAPPAHSIAVLPFVNLSGDREQEYFSEGLTEELLTSLSRINQLQVAARTSSFSFQGEHPDIATVAHRLNVGAVLEGTVRRSANTVRVTTELVNGITGFQLWSQTYDRDLDDVLKLQTEIATAVASALKVTLLGNEATKIEAGGTNNPAAFDAYLRASKAYRGSLNQPALEAAIAGYGEAIRLDPDYAIAYADRAVALRGLARNWATAADVRDYEEKSTSDARKAIELAPDLAEGHLALANNLEQSLEFPKASEEYDRALALAPGNAKVQSYYGQFAVQMGRTERGIAAAQRSVQLDPLNPLNHFALGETLVLARRFEEALRAFADGRSLDPADGSVYGWLGFAYYLKGDVGQARTACEAAADPNALFCLAMVYAKLERRAEAEKILARYLALPGRTSSSLNAMIYAQWGDTARALDSLETGLKERDPYMEYLKVNAFFDPLRREPRFQAVLRKLDFPD